MKTVVITGSTRGIGFGLAEAFVKQGCNVVICGRNQAGVDHVLDQLAQHHPAKQVLGQPCDITDLAQVQALWDAAQAQFGRIDLWINNAGLSNVMQPFWSQPPEMLRTVVDTNLTGLMYGCQVAIKGMIAQGSGHVYNMEGFGSDGRIRAGLTPYGTTKYALRYLTNALVEETKDTPVKVSAISPGMVVTDMLMDNIEPGQEAQARRVFNILADRVETVTPWLVEQMLANERTGARIAWLTTPKIIARFLLSPFRQRDVLN